MNNSISKVIKLPNGWTWKSLEQEVSGKQTGNLKRRVQQNIEFVNSVINNVDYEVRVFPTASKILDCLQNEKLKLTIKPIDGVPHYTLHDSDGIVLTEEYKEDIAPFEHCSFSVNDSGKVTAIFF